MDKTGRLGGEKITVDDLLQGRSPSLDLDCLYGLGPSDPQDARFYESDEVRLRMGITSADSGMAPLQGFDLARRASSTGEPGTALIPDHRNDENLAVAQLHLAFIRFHNRVVGELTGQGNPSVTIFDEARKQVVMHYQWMLRRDYLPRIVDPNIVEDVFTNGRKFFDVPVCASNSTTSRVGGVQPGDTPTMPIEFSVAAFRLGHSMVRAGYQWNSIFNNDDPPGDPRRFRPATLQDLFDFSGTSGSLTEIQPLPSVWIADFRRLFDLVRDGGAGPDLAPPAGGLNFARRIDTRLGNPLGELAPGSSAAEPGQPFDRITANLAFRNLMRADMVTLASGQQAAEHLEVGALSPEQILAGDNGVDLNAPAGKRNPDSAFTDEERERLVTHTPLWFYILRESEFNRGQLNGEKLDADGSPASEAVLSLRFSTGPWKGATTPSSETRPGGRNWVARRGTANSAWLTCCSTRSTVKRPC
ncbi:peroxidase family protein [Acrocarpospora sp. B8E8]|uniref:peroxidase family protein n=1 Tax=Acrocarpospora sp. B8E8 TaxID=3153572 RepID=UPI00325CF73A